MANPKVTAGFKCAALLPHATAVKMPDITANAHPAVMTIQPPPAAFERFNRTLATTPFPSRIKITVPRNSPSKGESMVRKRLLCNRNYPVEEASHGILHGP